MVLKVVLFSFTGIIIDDEEVRQTLSNQRLLDENLRPDEDDYARLCLGRSDRACLKGLLAQRGRTITDEAVDGLLAKGAIAYESWLNDLAELPLYSGLDDLIERCRSAGIKLALVTGRQRPQVELVLERAGLSEYFSVIVAGDDVSAEGSKPAADGYVRAIEQLNVAYPELKVAVDECIAIEDSFAGIEAAKAAGVPVVGVAHTYPHHMLLRRADWVVDYLREIKFGWIGERFGGERVDIDKPSEEILEEAVDVDESSD